MIPFPSTTITMTPVQKIKQLILLKRSEFLEEPPPEVTIGNVDALYEAAEDDPTGSLQDAREEIRCSGEKTNLQAPISRNYEIDMTATQVVDGSWVAWPYFYGGGKHGEPGAYDWVSDAVAVACQSETRTVVFNTFTPL